MTVRILITVSRTWSEWSTMRTALEKVHTEYPGAVLVHGDCPKGDRDAAGMWRGLGGEVEAWPAQWAQQGRSAGFIRNTAMVKSAPALVLAFINGHSRGASHCAQLAEDAGIPVVRYEQQGD
jgi:hypothetical protein